MENVLHHWWCLASQEITIKLKMHSVKRKIPPPLKCKMFYTKITFRAFPLFTKILSSLTLSSLTPCLSQRKERVWLSKSWSESYDLTILQSHCLKRFGSFKDLSDRSGSVGLYDSDNPKQPWFLVIFINLIEGLIRPKWKIKSQ